MKYKDRVTSQLDTSQNRIDNLIKMLEANAPLSRDQFISELKALSRAIESTSEMVGLEDNDFAALEGRMR